MPSSIVLDVDPRAMLPLVADTLEELVQAALHNIGLWDEVAWHAWIEHQSGRVQALATRRPPNRLYRLLSDDEREGRGAPTLVSIVVGYRDASPALCAVHVLGVWSGTGSYATPLPVPAEALLDVTDRARAGQLALP